MIKDLNVYQKFLLCVMLIMALIFAFIYPNVISIVGYEYMDKIFVPSYEDDRIIYKGEVNGEFAQFIVSDSKTVSFTYGEKSYGPFLILNDPTAIPDDSDLKYNMTGIEIYENDNLIFRGGVLGNESFNIFYNEDGTNYSSFTTTYVSGGVLKDGEGNLIDTLKPSVGTIYELTHNPKLTHKGNGGAWFIATFISIINLISILFADDLFHLKLSLHVQDADLAEPSEWEIMARYISWTALLIVSLVVYLKGLQ